jgi:hypothetical protein
VIIGAVPTPERVISAAMIQDRLILGANSELMVVASPCP